MACGFNWSAYAPSRRILTEVAPLKGIEPAVARHARHLGNRGRRSAQHPQQEAPIAGQTIDLRGRIQAQTLSARTRIVEGRTVDKDHGCGAINGQSTIRLAATRWRPALISRRGDASRQGEYPRCVWRRSMCDRTDLATSPIDLRKTDLSGVATPLLRLRPLV